MAKPNYKFEKRQRDLKKKKKKEEKMQRKLEKNSAVPGENPDVTAEETETQDGVNTEPENQA